MLKNLITVLALAIPVLLTGCLQASSGYAPSESEIKAAMATALQQQNRKLLEALADDDAPGKEAEGTTAGLLSPHKSALYSLEKLNCRTDKTDTVFTCDVIVDMDAGFGRERQKTTLILMNKTNGWTVVI